MVVFAYICRIKLIHIYVINNIWDVVVVGQVPRMVVKATEDVPQVVATA